MALPLVGKIARGIGRDLIPSLWKGGLAPNQIYKALKFDYKVSWRRADMFKDIRQVTGLMRHERQFRAIPTNIKPAKYMFSDVDLPAARNYRLYSRVEYLNTITGETSDKIISFYINEFESIDDAMQQWLDYKEESQYKTEEQIQSWKFLVGEHNKGAPW